MNETQYRCGVRLNGRLIVYRRSIYNQQSVKKLFDKYILQKVKKSIIHRLIYQSKQPLASSSDHSSFDR